MLIDTRKGNKANHTVTVPREYLESLEEFYREGMQRHYNMRGSVHKVKRKDEAGEPTYEERALFVTDNEIEVDSVLVLDEEGRERGRFEKRQ